jgi:hypothetical protein
MTNHQILCTGEIVPLPPPANGTDYSIDELTGFIGGGLVEFVHVAEEYIMVVDENYIAKELPFNSKATWIYREMALRNGYLAAHVVRGDVAIIARNQIL